MAVLDFKRSLVAPSTLTRGTLQFVQKNGRFEMMVGDNNNLPVEANYLKLSGGTVTGGLTIDTNIASPLTLTRSSQVGIFFNDTSNPRYLGASGGNLMFGTSTNHANNNTVWHSGNLADYKQYGLGLTDTTTNGTSLVRLTDLNDTSIPTGVYVVTAGTANIPDSASGTVDIGYTGASGYITQKVQHIYANSAPRVFIRHYSHSQSAWMEWREVWHSATPTITNPTIEATQGLIIPSTAPSSPEAGKTYIYIS